MQDLGLAELPILYINPPMCSTFVALEGLVDSVSGPGTLLRLKLRLRQERLPRVHVAKVTKPAPSAAATPLLLKHARPARLVNSKVEVKNGAEGEGC